MSQTYSVCAHMCGLWNICNIEDFPSAPHSMDLDSACWGGSTSVESSPPWVSDGFRQGPSAYRKSHGEDGSGARNQDRLALPLPTLPEECPLNYIVTCRTTQLCHHLLSPDSHSARWPANLKEDKVLLQCPSLGGGAGLPLPGPAPAHAVF